MDCSQHQSISRIGGVDCDLFVVASEDAYKIPALL